MARFLVCSSVVCGVKQPQLVGGRGSGLRSIECWSVCACCRLRRLGQPFVNRTTAPPLFHFWDDGVRVSAFNRAHKIIGSHIGGLDER